MKAVVVGAGPHGRRIVQMLREMDGITLAGVADTRQDALASLDLGPETTRYDNAASMFAAERADLACIATNGPSHAVLAIDAMRNGATRVLVEKPMACSLDECDSMIEEASRRGVRLSVDQIRRVDPFYRWIAEQIRVGRWGQLRHIWIQRPGIGLACLGTHSFDLARQIASAEVASVSGWVDSPVGRNPRGSSFVDPGGLVVLEFTNRVRCTIAQIEDGAGPMSVEIVLTGARLRIDEKSAVVEIVERDLTSPTGPGKPPVYSVVTPPVEHSSRFAMQTQVKMVLKELAGDGDFSTHAAHGRAAVEILVAAHLSSARGHLPVTLPLRDAESRAFWLPVT